MCYKIFATFLMFSILMICLPQSFTEEAADTTNPFIVQLSDQLRPVWRFVYAPAGKMLVSESSDSTLYLWGTP